MSTRAAQPVPGIPPGIRLRRHQREALAALAGHWAGGLARAWVVLPPGAGKTLVGLLTAHRMLTAGEVRRVVVLGPNTAIQDQWARSAAALGLEVGTDRSLASEVTALTYQSVAVFDADDEVDDDGVRQSLLARLHDNGAALVAGLRAAGPLLLVLDECHHLLEAWGRLLAEILDDLPQARVLGLTATPREALTGEQAQLEAELFGPAVYEASIPAVVREGDLAPFAELAWLVTPTPVERDWLAGQSTRFAELVTQLTDPTFGTIPFLAWLDARFCSEGVDWTDIAQRSPDLADAALRAHWAGLIGAPPGARLGEAHRVRLTAEDWVVLVDDWLRRGLAGSDAPADHDVVTAVRRALPAVGYQWTRRGIRRGRSPVDRVLARSEAKTEAAVQITLIEQRNLGERLRLLVLCDHERAAGMLPVDLRGVLDNQSGSARAVLAALLEEPGTAALGPLLVTGQNVAGAPGTLARLRDFVSTRDPRLAAGLSIEPWDGDAAASVLAGAWRSQQWVGAVTAFLEIGATQVLIGTRGLLGEGWDARCITGLVDLTAATTTTAVVQTRGRALRVDPTWPEKVALTWSVVCVAEDHPRGDNDWDRLVAKHSGFFGVDDAGDVVDGVGHLDPAFTPFAPPDRGQFDAINARMAVRSEDRAGIAAKWRIGQPYQDRVMRSVRFQTTARSRIGPDDGRPLAVVQGNGSVSVRGAPRPPPSPWWERALAGGGGAAATVWLASATGVWAAAAPTAVSVGAGAAAALAAAGTHRTRTLAAHGRQVLADAARPPGIGQIARAVADALLDSGLVSAGAAAVQVVITPDGQYRCVLSDVPEAESAVFASALGDALAPIDAPRYVIPRWTVTGESQGWWPQVRAAFGRVDRPAESWHPVPAVLGVNARRAAAFGRAWQHWVGGGDAVYTGSPEGAGILAAQRGADPFAVTSVMRRHWS